MLDKIVEIICEEMCIEVGDIDITADTNIREDLDIDSLSMVQIVMALEDEFNVEISDELAETFDTIGDFIDFIISQK